jgi:tRNA A-37 threonylcarbamoyl transferase component Bud32
MAADEAQRMTSHVNDRWERVSSLFAAARMLDADARDSFLSAACRGDAPLRAEVEALLAADGPEDDFLAPPPWTRLAESVAASLESGAGLEAGQVLSDRYCIERELAAGGQALVYLAHDQRLMMHPVVVKVLRAESRWNRWLRSRLEREMEALARIDHPGVVGILDVGSLEDGSPFLVIQHVPGVSLRELLAEGPVSPARAAGILRQIGSALGAAHEAGVAHRDLKPENIMLLQRNDGSDVVRLIDFGISRIESDGLEPGVTAVMLAGTVRYMAPEQLDGRPSNASDIYALALVACELLGGYPHIGALPATVNARARAVLESALAYRAEDRPADVRAWSESLARSLEQGGRRARRVFLVALAAAAGVAALSAIEWKILSGEPEPVRIIEKVGAFPPSEEGFRVLEDVAGSGVADNATRTGYDAWRVVSRSHGLYLYPFTAAQSRRALERGWKITVEMRAEEGAVYAAADFEGVGPGFPINVLREGDSEVVRLPSRVIPDFRGLEFVQSPAGEYHRYELVYDPMLRTADLWVDGVRRLNDYPGWTQNPYQLDAGLHFGAAIYRSVRGVGSFRTVRMEINP